MQKINSISKRTVQPHCQVKYKTRVKSPNEKQPINPITLPRMPQRQNEKQTSQYWRRGLSSCHGGNFPKKKMSSCATLVFLLWYPSILARMLDWVVGNSKFRLCNLAWVSVSDTAPGVLPLQYHPLGCKVRACIQTGSPSRERSRTSCNAGSG